MRGVNESWEYNRARKNMIIGGAAPLIRITALSCVSSILIYRAGFGEPPFIFQQAHALLAVVVVEGALRLAWWLSAVEAAGAVLLVSCGT